MISKNIFEGCTQLTKIVFPYDISSVDLIDIDSLTGSNIDFITFLGIELNESTISKIKSSRVFGLAKNCTIQDKNNNYYTYTSNSNKITLDNGLDINKSIAQLKEITHPKFNLKLGKISKFRKDVVEFCFQNKIPFVILYSDSMTSVNSKNFYDQFNRNFNIIKELKNIMCPFMFLDRQNEKQDTSTLGYYRTTLNEYIHQKQRDYGQQEGGFDLRDNFVNFTFVYDNGSKMNAISKSFLDFQGDTIEQIKTLCDQCGFSQFDPTPWYIDVDIPDYETQGTETINENDFKSNNSNNLPWWYSNGSIKNISTVSGSTTAIDWHDVIYPEGSYFVLMGYDMNYPSDAHQIVQKMKNIIKRYSEIIVLGDDFNNCEIIADGDTYQGMMCDKLKKGLKYKFMFFYENSHGNTNIITVDRGAYVTRDSVWKVLKTATNRIFGIFDSCYSGTMIKKTSSSLMTFSTKLSENKEQSNEPKVTFAEYIINKFKEQKLNRSKMLRASNTHEPTIVLWSSAPEDASSLYYPGGTTFLVDSTEYSLNNYSSQRFQKIFDEMFKDADAKYAAYNYKYSDGSKIGPPKMSKYGNDVMTFIGLN